MDFYEIKQKTNADSRVSWTPNPEHLAHLIFNTHVDVFSRIPVWFQRNSQEIDIYALLSICYINS